MWWKLSGGNGYANSDSVAMVEADNGGPSGTPYSIKATVPGEEYPLQLDGTWSTQDDANAAMVALLSGTVDPAGL